MVKATILVLLLMIFFGCEEKAVPVENTPGKVPEQLPEQGYINTH